MANPLKWHGGKTYLAKEIIKRFPSHTRYVEPYFGGGAVLFAKPHQGVSEFANDLNLELMNFWRVLQNEFLGPLLIRRLNLEPFSKPGFTVAKVKTEHADPNASPVLRAANFFVRYRQSRQGLGKDFATPTSRTRRNMNEQVSAWLSAVEGLPEAAERLRQVEVRNEPATDLIVELDSPETLFYLDPPYLPQTRNAKKAYGDFEATVEHHELLLKTLADIKGKFILSGYDSSLYGKAARANKWKVDTIEIDNKASSAKEKEIKQEKFWFNFSRREFGKGLK